MLPQTHFDPKDNLYTVRLSRTVELGVFPKDSSLCEAFALSGTISALAGNRTFALAGNRTFGWLNLHLMIPF